MGLTESDQLSEWRDRLDEMGDTTATFEWAFRWLAANRPAPSPHVLVHGDFRMGNLIVDESRARGGPGLGAGVHRRGVRGPGLVLHPGVALRCTRDLGAGGLGSIESFLSAYESAARTELDRDVFRWWLTVATLRWGVICRFQAERHLSGQTPSVELAAIGRRVAETEWDVLDLLTGGGPR